MCTRSGSDRQTDREREGNNSIASPFLLSQLTFFQLCNLFLCLSPQCCVSARSVYYLRASLKVARHLRSPVVAHRKMVVRLLILLSKECPRIGSWEELCDADEQQKVREILATSEMKKLQRQLAGRHLMDPEISLSRKNSFTTSLHWQSTISAGATFPSILQHALTISVATEGSAV